MSAADDYVDKDKLSTSELIYSGIQLIVSIAMIGVSKRIQLGKYSIQHILDWRILQES